MRRAANIWPLMEAAFPRQERRTLAQQQAVLDNPLYHLELERKEGAVIGFAGYWQLGDYIFIEHLAVDPHARGQGVGGKIVRRIMRQGKPVALEVEMPPSARANLIENRRIRFYERLGFIQQPYPYFHPAYDGSGERIPLLLLVQGKGVLPEDEFVRLLRAIHATVYGCA